jgi:hypothetical protein
MVRLYEFRICHDHQSRIGRHPAHFIDSLANISARIFQLYVVYGEGHFAFVKVGLQTITLVDLQNGSVLEPPQIRSCAAVNLKVVMTRNRLFNQ